MAATTGMRDCVVVLSRAPRHYDVEGATKNAGGQEEAKGEGAVQRSPFYAAPRTYGPQKVGAVASRLLRPAKQTARSKTEERGDRGRPGGQ
ncbi:hypothetical protein MRX96_034825 [Rhipicephalus microplus]